MFVFLSKYKGIVVFVCLCAISLILSWYTAGAARKAESYDNSLKHRFSVFLVPAHLCSSAISTIWARVAYVGSILASVYQEPAERNRIQILEGKVKDLERRLDEEIDEKKRLKELYEACANMSESGSSFKLAAAKVIAVEPTDWFRYLTIDKGENHGIEVDTPVITRSAYAVSDPVVDTPYATGAIVGRIADVQPRSARVQLITDRFSVVAVAIESLGDLVLLSGQPEAENCVIDEIPSTTHDMLKEGNAVIVDERSSIFPPGMLVGRISSIRKGIHFCHIEVEPAFKFSKLREVMVVLSK